ncbi:REST corepressor 1 [Geodia barretti]|uniref:REST corepressor 1 n=1 Tax=Geodia barretti TaxID=519541 RepID=A0AA35SHS8_GEOBA|nr:REST corepressor 1 [Geodia barretti]
MHLCLLDQGEGTGAISVGHTVQVEAMSGMNTRSVQRALNSIMGPTAEAMANGLQEPAMRIGAEFQVAIPDMSEFHSTTDPDSMSQGSGSILVWTPNPNLKTEYLDGYLKVAKEQFGYGMEQALGLLYWHKYNIEKAVEDLSNFCPIQEEWNMEDKVTFEQAFQYHGKNFQRIRTMLPEKPISGLVKYYYLWKRSYSQYSLMDKHAKKNGRRIVSSGQLPNNDDADSTGSWSTNDTLPFSQPTTVLLSSKGKQLPRGIHLHTTELVAVSSDVERGADKTAGQRDQELERKDPDLQAVGERESQSRQRRAPSSPRVFEEDAIRGSTRWSRRWWWWIWDLQMERGRDRDCSGRG